MANTLMIDDAGNSGDASYRRIALARAARLIVPSIAGVSSVCPLLNVPVSWEARDAPRPSHPAGRPRLRSPRRRGVAPDCPHDAGDAAPCEGTLVVFPAGFVLEPADPRHPCLNIARSTVGAATFYRDAFDVTLSSGACFVVRTAAVEQVDSIFQAYFWNPLG